MSLVEEQVRRLDTLLDRYSINQSQLRESEAIEQELELATTAGASDNATERRLKNTIHALSSTSTSRPLLKRRRLHHLIRHIQRSSHDAVTASIHGEDLVWLAAGKATVQVYGHVLDSLLAQTIPLSESLWYWDDVLGSYVKTGLYMLQTSPIRLWKAGHEIYNEARSRYESDISISDVAEQSRQDISQSWQRFYGLVRQSIRDRSLVQARTRILSPFAISRTEARQKLELLKAYRAQNATAIGLLVDEGLAFPVAEYNDQSVDVDWRGTIVRSIAILESILHHSQSLDRTTSDYEFNVIETINTTASEDQPSQLAGRLVEILDRYLPDQEQSSKLMAAEYGKPPRWVRYWIPGTILVLSGSTLLRIFANRRAEITTWIRELGQTTIDFWYNWVVEPTKRLIGTIRHDETAEVAIMSRDSLKSDRESLERMVVDFAIEHPESSRSYNEIEIEQIRSKVREGDLTPVLRVYEQDMKSPVVKAVTGNLIQALLIQIQKTKVDVEVAIGGIDSLLKSQELLFGFVGVAPGILLSYFIAQWLRGVLGGRRSIGQLKNKDEIVRLLRNIDRTLANSVPTENGLLSFKDHGLLICEAQVLRKRALAVLPGEVKREFLEDLDDLLEVRSGMNRQIKVVERIQWAYSKWLR